MKLLTCCGLCSTCYGETSLMDFGLLCLMWLGGVVKKVKGKVEHLL